MRNREMRLGSVMLLFTVIVLCVTALCVLTLVSAHADKAVAEKYAAQMDAFYETERAGQEWLAQVDAAADGNDALSQSSLPVGTQFDGETVSAVLDTGNGRTLTVMLQYNGAENDRWKIIEWKNTAQWQEDETIGSLWTGALE